MPTVEFELTVSAGERPKTYALDRAATGTGINTDLNTLIILTNDPIQTAIYADYLT